MRSIKLTALQFIETNLTVCKGSSTSATLCDCLLGPSIIPLASLGQLQGVSLHIRIQKPLMDDNPQQNLIRTFEHIPQLPVTSESIANALFFILHSAVFCLNFFSKHEY